MLTLLQVAAIAHNAQREYALHIGDTSYPTWEEAPFWQRNSCIDGVKFHLTHPYAPAEASHENWLRLKREEGWVWGPVKDPEKKEHPCVMPFNQLPPEQKVKDWLFKAIINAIAAEGQVLVEYPPV